MKNLALLFTCFAISIFAIGCADSAQKGTGSTDTHSEDDGHDHDDHDGHDHGDHDGHDHAAHDHTAKHGGHLIEIGRNHEYHAELVDDHKTESITVYMMDSHMEPLTVKSSSISLVLTAGDETKTFELMASQPGGSAEFKSSDAKMMEMIEGEDVKGKLRVTIDGKPFSGTFDHHGQRLHVAVHHGLHDGQSHGAVDRQIVLDQPRTDSRRRDEDL